MDQLKGKTEDRPPVAALSLWRGLVCLLIGGLLAGGLLLVIVGPEMFDFGGWPIARDDTAGKDVAQADAEDEDSDGGTEAGDEGVESPAPKKQPDAPLPPNSDPKINLAAQSTPEPEPVAPKALEGPWVETLAAEPKGFSEIAFDDFPFDGRDHPETQVKDWFAPTQGVGGTLTDKEITARIGDSRKVRAVAFRGVFKLRAPWTEGQALRLSLYEPRKFKMHFWNGTEGVTLVRCDAGRATWAAYRSTREAGQPISKSDVLVGTDEDRCRRVERHGGVYDLRCEGGRLVLSRGGIMIVSAPLEGMPQEVYLAGTGTLAGVSLVRSTGLPQQPKPRPAVLDADKPAALSWAGEPADGSRLRKRDDGGVEITAAENTTQLAFWGVPLPKGGLHEIVFEIENPRPGAGIYLGDEQGRPRYRVGFFHDANKGRTTLEYLAPGTTRTAAQKTPNDPHTSPIPALGRRHWVKLLLGCGTLKVWVSGDGQHWGRAFDPVINLRGGAHYAGLYTLPGKQSSGVKLRRMEVRSLDAINALAPASVLKEAVAPIEAPDYVAWLAAVTQHQPGTMRGEAASATWRRACAINTLAAGPNTALAGDLIERLLASRPFEENAVEALTVDARLRLLDQMALVSDTWSDYTAVQRVLNSYFELAEAQRGRGQKRPYSTIARRWMNAPLWTQYQFPNPPTPQAAALIHAELLGLAAEDEWQAAWQFCRQLKAWGQFHTVGTARWTEAWAARRLPEVAADDGVLLPAKWRHPLVVEVGKEAFNVMAEFEAALRGKSYKSACRIVSSASTKENLGLLPDRQDARLLISMRGAVESGMHDHPDLRRTMKAQFGPLGKLRVSAATAAGDEERVEAVTVQFYGTEAAGQAHLWLGNRALARGDFNVALEQYRRASQFVDRARRGDVAARRRLAGAMLGRDEGEPVTAAVHFGPTEMSADEFEKLVVEMKTTHAPQRRRDSSGDLAGESLHDCPAPAAYTAHLRARLDGEMGSDPNSSPDGIDQTRFDWRARQMGISVVANMMYVSNRFQISAYDLNSGGRRWQVSLGADRGRMRDWSLAAMKPLVVGKRIFARRLSSRGPELVCLEAATGKILWSTKLQTPPAGQPRRNVACDPMVVQDQLLAITVQQADRHTSLHLAWFDDETGRLIREQRLTDVRDAWHDRPVCEATAAGSAIVVSLGGGLLCCDGEGVVRWVRKLPWLPRELDASYGYQAYDGPTVVGRRAFFVQPGTRTVQCVDVDTGRAVWNRCLSDVRRLIGKVGDVLLLETDRGLVGLDATSGEPLWRHDQDQRLDARAWGGTGQAMTGQVMIAIREKTDTAAAPWRVALLWLDSATGEEVGRTSIAELQDKEPTFGPFIAGNKRLWAFFGRAAGGRTRDLVELVPKGEATTPIADKRVWTSHVDEKMRRATAEVLPGWSLISGTGDPAAGHLKHHAGQNDVLALASPSGKPVWLARRITVPKGERRPLLRIKVAKPPGGTAWRLEVRAAGVKLAEKQIDATTAASGWVEVEVSLADLVGRSVYVLVGQTATQGARPIGYWQRLDVVF